MLHIYKTLQTLLYFNNAPSIRFIQSTVCFGLVQEQMICNETQSQNIQSVYKLLKHQITIDSILLLIIYDICICTHNKTAFKCLCSYYDSQS